MPERDEGAEIDELAVALRDLATARRRYLDGLGPRPRVDQTVADLYQARTETKLRQLDEATASLTRRLVLITGTVSAVATAAAELLRQWN